MSELLPAAALCVGVLWCFEMVAMDRSMAAQTIRLARTNVK